MSEDIDPIVIGFDRSKLTLKGEGPAEYGWFAEGHFEAGALEGQINTILIDPQRSCEELERFHRQLDQKWTLQSLDHDLCVSMTPDDLGHVGVEIRVSQIGPPEIDLTYRFGIDQSFLPPMIRAFRANFPQPRSLANRLVGR